MLGLINTLIRPVLVLLTLPVTMLTLGLFIFVINGLLFWAVGTFVEGFHVDGFWAGVFGAIVYSLISWALSSLCCRKLKRASADAHAQPGQLYSLEFFPPKRPKASRSCARRGGSSRS